MAPKFIKPRKPLRRRKIVRGRKTFKKSGDGLRKLIKSVIRGQAEKKKANVLVLGQSVVSANNVGASSYVQQISPGTGSFNILQGLGQSDRVGNRIKIVKCHLKGSIVPLPYHGTTNSSPSPQVVQMFIGYDKLNPLLLPDPYGSNDFFQFGNTQSDWQNDLVDTWAPINTDRWKVVYRRKFKVGYSNFAGTGVDAGSQMQANNDFKLNANFSVDVTKWMVKNVVFDDNALDPSTRGLYFWFCACEADGLQQNGTQISANVCYSADLVYTDI